MICRENESSLHIITKSCVPFSLITFSLRYGCKKSYPSRTYAHMVSDERSWSPHNPFFPKSKPKWFHSVAPKFVDAMDMISCSRIWEYLVYMTELRICHVQISVGQKSLKKPRKKQFPSKIFKTTWEAELAQ